MTQDIAKLDRNLAPIEVADGLNWYDIRDLGVEGRGWSDTVTFYDRLPARAKGKVREPVWNLATHSAGMAVRFVTDAPAISARWTLRHAGLAMDHMPATGMSGLDLYGVMDGAWRWAGVGRPTIAQGREQKAVLMQGRPRRKVHYLLYLPLYNGVEKVAIGVPSDAKLTKAPPRKPRGGKPVCFYGTSIVQGGCASRSGMGYPEILGRRLDRETINLGFSGNGPMDLEMAEFLGELNVAAYVLDGLPNMQPQVVADRFEPFVTIVRKARPKTPIVLVENITYQSSCWLPDGERPHNLKNAKMQAAYKRLLKASIKGLHYVRGGNLLGDDGLATVDGTHPTDVGFLRMADAIGPVLERALSR